MNIVDRLMEKVSPEPNSGCWLWLGSVNNSGYGSFVVDGRPIGAHRLSYELFCGPIPKGLQIDHLCKVRCCVNPKHLEIVTKSENFQRSSLTGQGQSKMTRCRNGHLYDIKNTRYYLGGRHCRECRRNGNTRRLKERNEKCLG